MMRSSSAGYATSFLPPIYAETSFYDEDYFYPETGQPIGSSFTTLEDRNFDGVSETYDILLAGTPRLRLLVGHSKGNLLISFVLNHMKDELGDRAARMSESRHPLFDHLTEP